MGSFSAFMGSLGELVRAPFRPVNLFVLVALIVVTGSALFIDQQNRALQEQQLRSQVTRQVSVIRTRLEGNINGNLQLVRGLVATLVTEPGMGQTRFARLASQVLSEESQLRSIAGAPNLKVTMTYPLKGNEKVIGLDYTQNAINKTLVAPFSPRPASVTVVGETTTRRS